MDKILSKIIDLKDARCSAFKAHAPVLFANEEEGKKGEFVIEAYTGEVVDRWWGKLAVAVDGIKSKKSMPVLRDHDRSMIVGYSKKAWKDGSFYVSGAFSGVTEAAKECRALAEEGFPWQASVGIRPLKVMSIEDGGKMEVNGKTLKGPAEVWLESEVQEVSFVPLGADSKTSVSVFSNFDEAVQPASGDIPPGAEHKPRSTIMKLTLEEFKKEYPELFAQIWSDARAEGLTAGKAEGLAEGVKKEAARIKAVSEQLMPGHEALITKLMYDGSTTGEQAAVQVLAAEKLVRVNATQNLNADGVPPVRSTTPAESLKKIDDAAPATESVCKAEFEADPKLAQEFGGDFSAYFSYRKAMSNGQVRKK